jgi:hypothetical protein
VNQTGCRRRKEGGLGMNMCLYWPKPEAQSGDWTPPDAKEVKYTAAR